MVAFSAIDSDDGVAGRTTTIRDSLYDRITLRPRDVAILGTPEFLRLDNIKQLGFVSRVWPGEWRDQYRLSLIPRRWSDFAPMCHYHQTSPESGFTRGSVCSLATATGRITIADQRLLITTSGEKRETELADEASRKAALYDYCGIAL